MGEEPGGDARYPSPFKLQQLECCCSSRQSFPTFSVVLIGSHQSLKLASYQLETFTPLTSLKPPTLPQHRSNVSGGDPHRRSVEIHETPPWLNDLRGLVTVQKSCNKNFHHGVPIDGSMAWISLPSPKRISRQTIAKFVKPALVMADEARGPTVEDYSRRRCPRPELASVLDIVKQRELAHLNSATSGEAHIQTRCHLGFQRVYVAAEGKQSASGDKEIWFQKIVHFLHGFLVVLWRELGFAKLKENIHLVNDKHGRSLRDRPPPVYPRLYFVTCCSVLGAPRSKGHRVSTLFIPFGPDDALQQHSQQTVALFLSSCQRVYLLSTHCCAILIVE
mmetsp:Transcript_1289/g.2674  ORF Transcript_1289/g.2674 Transcript_1289/m.2674 type:complete len:334 (-) Transcript_1289:337-1338(-)